MKKTCIILMLFLLLIPANIVFADQEMTGEVISVGNPEPGSGETLIAKTEQMANDLHRAASRVIIPVTIISVIAGALIGIFIPLFRKLALFAVFGLVLVLWAPMLVNAVANWVG